MCHPSAIPPPPPQILSGQKSQPRLLGGGEVLASEAVRLEFQRASTGGGDAAPPPLQRPSEGADCCVCFEPLQQAGQRISFCAACGNNVHGDCIGHWLRSQRQRGGQPSCPLCRCMGRRGGLCRPGGVVCRLCRL